MLERGVPLSPHHKRDVMDLGGKIVGTKLCGSGGSVLRGPTTAPHVPVLLVTGRSLFWGHSTATRRADGERPRSASSSKHLRRFWEVKAEPGAAGTGVNQGFGAAEAPCGPVWWVPAAQQGQCPPFWGQRIAGWCETLQAGRMWGPRSALLCWGAVGREISPPHSPGNPVMLFASTGGFTPRPGRL